ncbi:Ig-like domain-containing protein [Polaribacter gangjinensis]|uniref:GH16 domain-containing protein n=1 Tax=Polaribacter gangjinensis TaxID=574710 RepID=A0A2S7WCR0_9FLAO|nr:Ig-like domain-containing protein [Polaribacter gangjinensis]PQJ75196.1 hypothetical protein BTO13_08030 [Polaribacter gangjinensis]
MASLCALFLLSYNVFAQTNANSITYFEDFNSQGYPTNLPVGSYWTFHNEIYPNQVSWTDFMPGDGYAYLTVDADISNDLDWIHPFQTLEFGGVAQNHRLEVRMKGAVVDGGLVGFLFTYNQEGEIFNEVDIEVVARDSAVPWHETLPFNGGWTDARYNTWGNANENTNQPFTGTMKPVVNQLNEKISLIDDEFHIYTIDWREDKIDFFIDGVLQETITTSIAKGVSEVIIGFRQLPWAGAFNWGGTHTMVIDYLKIEPLESITFATNDKYTMVENTTLSMDVLANDSSNTSIVAFDALSAQGFPVSNTASLLSYTPATGFIGQDSFTYTLEDANGGQATATVFITVEAYVAPLGAVDDAITVGVNSANTPIDVTANDAYGPNGVHPSHPLTLPGGKLVTASANGGDIAVVDGKVNYTPKAGFAGIDTFVYTITDGNGYADQGLVTITVGGAVAAVAVNDAFDVVVDTATALDVLANDTTNTTIVSFDVTSAQGFVVSGTVSNVTYTPTGGYLGEDSFSYTIQDTNGNQSTATVTLTVKAAVVSAGVLNAVDDAITVGINSANTPIDVVANDNYGVNGPNATHPLTLPGGKLVTASVHGGDIAVVNGKVNYTPKTGFTGVDSFEYTLTDSKGFADKAIVSITVGGAVAAVAVNDAFDVEVDTATPLNVLANDTANSTIVSYDVTSAQGFSVSGTSSLLTYTPTGGYVGQDSFNYTIEDANGNQSTATVTLTVKAAVVSSGVLSAVNDAVTVGINSTNTPIDVVANDNFGVNGPNATHPLTLTNGKIFHASNNGGDISVVNGKVNYTPKAGFAGIDTFTYTLTDSKGFAAQGIVTVTVGGNVSGVATNDAFDVILNTATNLDVLANDTGTGLYIISYDANSLQGFSVTGNSSSLTYTPTGGFLGTDSFSYTIADANGDETTAIVTLTIKEAVVASGPLNAVNDAITVQPGNSNTIIDVLANDSFGANGPNATHALTLTNGKIFHASVKGGDIAIVNGKVTYTPKNGFTGIDSFDYTITDAKGFADTGYVTVTVGEAQSKTAIKDNFEARNDATEFGLKENSFSTYPNPSKGYLKTTLFSTHTTQATVLLMDVTGKVVYSSTMTLQKGMNAFEMTVSLAPGIVLMKVISSEVNFGTQKIVVQ